MADRVKRNWLNICLFSFTCAAYFEYLDNFHSLDSVFSRFRSWGTELVSSSVLKEIFKLDLHTKRISAWKERQKKKGIEKTKVVLTKAWGLTSNAKNLSNFSHPESVSDVKLWERYEERIQSTMEPELSDCSRERGYTPGKSFSTEKTAIETIYEGGCWR